MDKEQSDRQLGYMPSFDSWTRDRSYQFDGDSWEYSRKANLPTGGYLIGGPGYFSMNISYSSVSDTFRRVSGPSNQPSPWSHSRMFYPTVSLGDDPNLLESGILNFYAIWLNDAYFESVLTRTAINRPQGLPTTPDHYFDQSFRAVEVLLHFCVKTVNTTVSNGIPKTDMITTGGTSQIFHNGEENIYSFTTDDKIAPVTFYVDEVTFAGLFYYLRSRIRGTFSLNLNPFWTVRGQTHSSEILGDALWSSQANWDDYSSIPNQDRAQDLHFRNKIRNIADSLTNMLVHTPDIWQRVTGYRYLTDNQQCRIRKSAWNTRPANYTKANREIMGSSFQENCILVQWPFLILIGVQVVISIIFLVCVIRQTNSLDVELFKSKLLPVLFAIDSTDRSRFPESQQSTSPGSGASNKSMGSSGLGKNTLGGETVEPGTTGLIRDGG